MKNFLKFGFLASLTIAAGFAVAGSPLIPAEVFASIGFGLVPFVGEVGGDMKKMLDQLADTAKSAKETVESVRKAHTELDGRVQKLHDELSAGKADSVTKAAFQDAVASVDKVEKALDKVNTELTELAAKAANGIGGAPQAKTLGQLAAESDVCKTYRGGIAELAQLAGPLFGKTAVTSASASAGALIDPYRVPGIIMNPDEPLTVRDLFTAVSISTNAIEWVKEKLFTNAAGYQAGEGAAKPESGLTYEKMTTAVATLAHWIPASRQVLADAPQLRGVIDGGHVHAVINVVAVFVVVVFVADVTVGIRIKIGRWSGGWLRRGTVRRCCRRFDGNCCGKPCWRKRWTVGLCFVLHISLRWCQ